MKNTIKYLILILIYLVCGVELQAQNYTFRNVVMSDGLSGLLVNAIYKDSEGFVWLGTDNCLDRFDGVKVRHFEFRGIESGRKKRVNTITETANKQLWVGNGIGLWRLNRASGQLERIVPEKIDFAVNTLLSDGDILYIGTEKGLFIHKDGQLLQVLTDRNMLAACNRIMDICLNEDKTALWLATVQGLFSYSLKDGKIDSWHFQENVPEADYFRCLTRIGETLYLGTMSQGVVRFDMKKKTFSHTISLGCDVISDISSDGKETVYIATDGNGVHFLSHKKQQVTRRFYHDVSDKEGIRSNSVYSLLVDDRGATLNRCFECAKGRYIARQDADDISDVNRLEKTVRYLEKTGAPYVGCGVRVFDDSGVWNYRQFPEVITKHIIAKKNPFFHPTMVFKREVFEQANGYRVAKETRRTEDYDLVMRLAALNLIGRNLQEILYSVYEPYDAYMRHTRLTRWYEICVRIHGLQIMKSPLHDYIYLVKPVIMGCMPRHCIKIIKKLQWNNKQKETRNL